jgi:hypothetical protein
VAVAGLSATLFALVIVLADVFVLRLPGSFGAAWPESLLLYPAMGWLAEVAFHLVPPAAVMIVLGPLRARVGEARFTGLCLAATSLAEPTYQFMRAETASAFIGLHVLAFNVVQLLIFRRYDPPSIMAARMVYYGWWHVLWGALRGHLIRQRPRPGHATAWLNTRFRDLAWRLPSSPTRMRVAHEAGGTRK